MQIGQLNTNLSRQLRNIQAGGEPVIVDYYGTPRVAILPPDLYSELLEAAGERGREVLERHRARVDARSEVIAA